MITTIDIQEYANLLHEMTDFRYIAFSVDFNYKTRVYLSDKLMTWKNGLWSNYEIFIFSPVKVIDDTGDFCTKNGMLDGSKCLFYFK